MFGLEELLLQPTHCSCSTFDESFVYPHCPSDLTRRYAAHATFDAGSHPPLRVVQASADALKAHVITWRSLTRFAEMDVP